METCAVVRVMPYRLPIAPELIAGGAAPMRNPRPAGLYRHEQP
jgi:hypothetical protein